MSNTSLSLVNAGSKIPRLRKRLVGRNIVFLTHDTEFEDVGANYHAKVIISRIRQNFPIRQRVEIWFGALQTF